MKIAVCGSISFMEQMRKHKEALLILGFNEVFIPKGFGEENSDDKEIKDRLTIEEDSQRKIEHDLIRRHFNLIIKSDCVLIANYEKKRYSKLYRWKYFLEMGYAFILGKPIFVVNPLPELPYITEMQGMQPIILNGDLKGINSYFELKIHL